MDEEVRKLAAGKRVHLVLWIPDGSPLAEGRMPVDASPGPGGQRVRVDALSCSALLASIGHYLPLDQVLAWFAFLHGKVRSERGGG